jgi:hypothetical protein
MPDSTTEIRAALARLAIDDVEVLFAVSQLQPASSPALLAWIEHAADWELQRRKGFDFRLAPVDEAIDASENAVATAAAVALHDEFAGNSALARFFASTVDALVIRGELL